MSEPEKTYKTTVPIYGTTFHLVVCDDVMGYHKRRLKEDTSAIAFTAWIEGVLTVVIPLRNNCIGTLAHEIVHAAGEILDHHSVRWGPKNQEPLTYLVGW